MLVYLYKYIKGYLIVKITGYSLERFLTLCCRNDINIWNLQSNDYEYKFCIRIVDFYKLKPFLRKTRTHIRILDKKGLPFFFNRYRKRKIFFAGLFLCAGMLVILSQFIWEIDFKGNVSLTDDVLLKFLSTQNVYSGIQKSKINSDDLKKAIRNNFNEVIWTSVEISGTRMIVYIKENENILPVDNNPDIPSSIIADKDGIIISIITRQGTPMVKAGDEIKKGTLLVDGKTPIYNDSKELTKYNYCIADADIYAQTVYEYYDKIPLEYEVKNFTGNNKESLYIRLFDKEIIFKIFNTKYENYDSDYSEKQLIIGKNIYLPFYWGERTDSEYTIETKKHSNEEADKLANEKLNAFCENLIENGVQILDKNVNIDIVDDACISKGFIIVNERIGNRAETEIVNIMENEEEAVE